jgi:hypothetical protein
MSPQLRFGGKVHMQECLAPAAGPSTTCTVALQQHVIRRGRFDAYRALDVNPPRQHRHYFTDSTHSLYTTRWHAPNLRKMLRTTVSRRVLKVRRQITSCLGKTDSQSTPLKQVLTNVTGSRNTVQYSLTISLEIPRQSSA